jgi:hypothetical protein
MDRWQEIAAAMGEAWIAKVNARTEQGPITMVR